jgi:hypothetical protein
MSPYSVSPTLGARVKRRLVSVCMFCEASHLPARGDAEDDRWAPLAPAIRDAIRTGTSGIVVSHGLCPRCARERYPELMS